MYKLPRPEIHSKCKIEDGLIYKGLTVSCQNLNRQHTQVSNVDHLGPLVVFRPMHIL